MVASSEFGAFFRKVRTGRGLSLRAFCRRSGFDQGNVSRLERGLLPPPRSDQALKAYAEALKLEPESADWERFMALARPPAQPHRRFGHRNWVRARHLEDWAGTPDAQRSLPQLIRRLIRATGDRVRRCDAPDEDQTQRPGWDIVVEAAGATEFVPQGSSGWEVSVKNRPKAKADDDWKKRAKHAQQDATFIFVTARKFQDKADWIKAKDDLRLWKDVRVYDSATLEEWLECAPAVDVWLARKLGLCPDGLVDVDEQWANLQALADLESAVYLASRQEELAKLDQALAGPPDSLVIESQSPAEAVDFIVAASRRPEMDEIVARTLIVESRDAWRSITNSDARLVLVVDPRFAIEPELVAAAVRKGHYVIACASGLSASPSRHIKLSRVSRLQLRQALEAQGIPRDEAADLATRSGGSITVLKRRMARCSGTVRPAWSQTPAVRAVVPFLLAGRWSDASEADRQALSQLADRPYSDLVERAEQWSTCPDPLLRRGLAQWELVSRDDSWKPVACALNDDDLQRFQQVALEVLGEPDPACDLPIEQRWQANILGKARCHSAALRRGLAESLALFGARPPEQDHLSRDPTGVAASIVRSLLDGKDWQAWASLSAELPLLGEAAPDEFLSALENDLDSKSGVVQLFESTGSFFGPSLHTGLLFALESLAWSGKWLPPVSRLLARLHEAVPDTKLGNSPMWSLEQVFMPWFPQTTAPVDDRIRMLKVLSEKHPQAGWRLLQRLLPTPHAMVLPNNDRPAFRDWALEWTAGAAPADRAFQIDACAYFMVDLAIKDANRLKDVIAIFESLPPSARTSLLEWLASVDPVTLVAEKRCALAEAIREKISRHRRFADAGWTLSESVLEKLDRIRTRLEPDDVAARNVWLFGDDWNVRESVVQAADDKRDPDEEVQRLREAAIAEVRKAQQWDGLLALAAIVDSPDQLGSTVGTRAAEGDDARVLPALLTDTRRALADFAKGYVRARLSQEGWVRQLALDGWSDDQLVELALLRRSLPQTWDFVAQRGPVVEEQYWNKVQQISLAEGSANVARACAMLTKVGRPVLAVRQLANALRRKIELDPSVILDVLRRAVAAFTNDDQTRRDALYDVKVLIQHLQTRLAARDTGVDEDHVAKLEWAYLALLDGHPAAPSTLHAWLANRPEFFVELLTILFRRNDAPEGQAPELADDKRARARQAYHLLNSWKRVPGTSDDGTTVDETVLRAWIKDARTLAEKEARLEMCDHRIGNVLAHAPAEADGTWPCIAVRDAIEEFGSTNLADGFEIGIFNKRGAYWTNPSEGANPTRTLAGRFLAWAEAARIEWPRTARSLRRIGEQYEADARREDAEAESRA